MNGTGQEWMWEAQLGCWSPQVRGDGGLEEGYLGE